MRRFTVTIRSHTRLVTDITVEAANTFMAHTAAMALHPRCRVVRIMPVPPDLDG